MDAVTDIPIAFVFTAGLVATVNPCGFAMLPAYLAYFLGLEDETVQDGVRQQGASVARGLTVGTVVSLGFFLVFAIFGAIVTAGFRSIIDFIPWVALAIGAALVVLGAAMLFFNYQLNLTMPHLERGGSSRSYSSMFVFGISYGVASLSCVLPVFLTVVGVATAASNALSSVLTFVFYGAGMWMTLLALTLGMAVGKDSVMLRLRRLLPYINRISGAILLVSGAFIAAFWAANLNDPLAARGSLFRFVEEIQVDVSNQLGNRPALWATVFGLLIASAVGYVWWSRRRLAVDDEGYDEADFDGRPPVDDGSGWDGDGEQEARVVAGAGSGDVNDPRGDE